MKASDINSLLTEKISSIEFKNFIEQEVANYSFQMHKQGASIPLILIENEIIQIDKNKLKILLTETVNGKLNNIYLAYICDCFTLSETIEFENEQIKELIYNLADPEINGGFKTTLELNEIISGLT